jgi:hypothetical protein
MTSFKRPLSGDVLVFDVLERGCAGGKAGKR